MKPLKHKTIELSQDAYILVTDCRDVHLAQIAGPSLRGSIDEFYHTSIRNRLKYMNLTKKEEELVEAIKKELFECVGEYL